MTNAFDPILDRLRPGMTVYLPGMSGESLGLYAALAARPDTAAGVRFVGVHFPGINDNDYLSLHPDCSIRGYFMTPSLRRGLREGRGELMPLDYPRIWRDLAENVNVDLAVAHVAPPDADGRCSLGPCVDFLPAVWDKAACKVAHINPEMQATRGSFSVSTADFDLAVESANPLVEFPGQPPDPVSRQCAAHVAGIVRDGDSIELGVGKLPAAILAALAGHRGLRVLSGLVSPQLLPLLDSGAIDGAGAVQTGVALGDSAFYRRVASDERFFFRPVCDTHNLRRLAAADGFCAINSAVAVDLLGQVNADWLDGRLVAGVGGLPVFVEAANLSAGGRSLICLPATASGGAVSRIVPRLDALTTIPRHAADHVVTEHGVAQLGGLDMEARAQALIAIAAPEHREELARSWRQLKVKI
ncbi:MAG: hypothetical protein L0H19_03040 [Salinisphaera sp.]|nr:hypothetical protein [Salinisphaera sp.]